MCGMLQRREIIVVQLSNVYNQTIRATNPETGVIIFTKSDEMPLLVLIYICAVRLS